MKLAEALARRADMVKQVAVLRERIRNNVVSKEGEIPAESALDLIKESFAIEDNLTALIKRINRTNSETFLDDERTMQDALAERDGIESRRITLLNAVSRASEPVDRYSNTELKTIRLIDVDKMQKQIDDLAKKHRELDLLIQEKNWLTELK